MSKPIKQIKSALPAATGDYSGLVSGVSELLEAARRTSAHSQRFHDGDLLGNWPAHRGV